MRIDALDRVTLYCPDCLANGQTNQVLKLSTTLVSGNYVIEGRLTCPQCLKEYPIVEGIPCFVEPSRFDPNLPERYLDAHYGHINDRYWKTIDSVKSSGICLDIGCSVGRRTFELGRSGFGVGVDINFELLSLAEVFQRRGAVSFQRKTRAMAQERVESGYVPSQNALFILADVHHLPFVPGTFSHISGLNFLDSVSRPLQVLGHIDSALKASGTLLLSTPYVWDSLSPSELLEDETTDPHTYVKALLTSQLRSDLLLSYQILKERSLIEWRLRWMDKCMFTYFADFILARKTCPAGNLPAKA